MSVRITGLQEVSTLQSGDYIAVDNESNGTHKFDAMKMGANMASNIAPAYSTAATYAIGDFCMHDNILYKCTTAISTPESWTASHWTQTSAGVALAQKVDKVSGKGLSQNDFTNALKTKLDGIASGAEVNVQADWSQTNTSADDYIKNKPVDATSSVGGLMSASDKAKLDGIASGAEVNVQANWTETNTSSDAYIKNKPTNATSSTAGLMSAADKAKLDGIASGAEVNVQADWSQTNTSADDYIKNKPVDATSSVGGLMSATDKAKLDSIEQGAEVNVQADWNQTNTSADDYIKNKPTNATTSTAGLMSASDKTKLNGIETGAQVNVIDGVKVDGTLLTVDGNKDVDIVGKANQASLAPQYSSDTGDYVRGNYVIYQNNLYKCLQDTSGVWDATKWEQVDIGDDLEQKANIDGLYEEMTVGGAEQLISDTFNIESVPYNFRTSGGSLDIGDRETDKLIGGTVAWNQIFDPSITWSRQGLTVTMPVTGTYRINGTLDSGSSGNVDVVLPANHVCYLRSGRSTTDIVLSNNSNYKTDATDYLFKPTTENKKCNIFLRAGTYTNADFIPQVFDLTQMFGTTIADYIYNLEQNTTGAGVAFFKKLFPAPYYSYNAGQLMSVNAGSHVMNGFNQWDEEWEVGSYDANGNPTTTTNTIRSKNAIHILPNTGYYIRGNGTSAIFVYFYDYSNTFISYTSATNGIVTSPANAYYMRLRTQSTYGSTYNNDICINIAWDGERNGEYEPYVSHAYELDDTLELRGIPKLDANNQLYYDGDVYESDGTVTRKYGIVDLGTLTWTYNNDTGGHPYFGTSISNKASDIYNLLCSKYATYSSTTALVDLPDKMIKGNTQGNSIYVRDYSYTDVATFKTAMSGVYLVYELATPTTESATPYTNPQIVDDWGTETYTDYSYDAQTRDVQIPVGHETRYMANLKAKLEMAPESPNGDGDYIVRQTSGENAYVAIGSSPTIQHKAEIDGTYDDMNVGGAKQLLSNVFEEDQVPYTFRTSGGSIDIGDREYDEVVGGTVAWNQLAEYINSGANNGITYTWNNDGSYTLNGTSTDVSYRFVASSILANHVSFVSVYSTSDDVQMWFAGYTGTQKKQNVYKPSATYSVCLYVQSGVTLDNVKAYPQVIDLTQMFGSTIADYIYSLETANEGAGVAWFRKLFPKPYYAYNAGQLLSVEGVSSHDMTGFNQWDEEWESGYINGSGVLSSEANSIRSKNFNPCVPNTTYYFRTPSTYTVIPNLAWYDSNEQFISRGSGSYLQTSPQNAAYFKISCYNYGATYNHDICINLHWDGERDGEYEPYVLHSYPLDDSLTLRGIPKLDASNNLYYDGDTYESDGTVTRKYRTITFNGSENWSWSTNETANRVWISVSDAKMYQGNLVGTYIVGASSNASYPLEWNGFINNTPALVIGVPTTIASANDWKTYLTSHPLTVVYELATPTTETADPFQSPQIVDDFGTEEYVTTSIVPVGHNTQYTANLRAKIEMAPDSPSGNGDYIMRQADGTNSYVPLVIPNELPTMPTTDGTYRLQVVVASGTPTLSWVSAT